MPQYCTQYCTVLYNKSNLVGEVSAPFRVRCSDSIFFKPIATLHFIQGTSPPSYPQFQPIIPTPD